jgi:hypothetical protein
LYGVSVGVGFDLSHACLEWIMKATDKYEWFVIQSAVGVRFSFIISVSFYVYVYVFFSYLFAYLFDC